MRMRLSAAYKGMNALLMKEGAQDFRSGQKFDHTVFFGENVDIHHIFPQDWCKMQGIKPAVFDSIINKTPLSYRTNRIIGGVAPSEYLAKLENGSSSTPPIASEKLDSYLQSHLITPALLRADKFEAFMEDRQKRLLGRKHPVKAAGLLFYWLLGWRGCGGWFCLIILKAGRGRSRLPHLCLDEPLHG